MVGVPRLAWWVCGPSSRISWPKPCLEKNRIRYGREQDRDRQRDTAPRPGRPSPGRRPADRSRPAAPAVAAATRSRPAARDALTSTTSPGSQLGAAAARAPSSTSGHRARRRRGRSPARADRDAAGRRRAARPAPPTSACAAAAPSPSSAIGPSTAQRRARPRPPVLQRIAQRERGAHRLRVGVVRVVDHGHAVRPLGDLHPPPRDAAAPRRARPRPPAAASPSSSATAAAASALPTWCAPTQPAASPEPRPAGRRPGVKRGPARSSSRTSSAARPCASGPRRPVTHPGRGAGRHRGDQRVVGVEHGDAVRPAAPRPARPWPPRSPPGEPNSPRCAVPTLSTTPIRGRADRGQRGDVAAAARGSLQHQVPGARVGPQRRARVAELVVERARAGRRSGPSGRQQLRRAGPWWRSCPEAGDADHRQPGQRADDMAGQPGQRGEHGGTGAVRVAGE